MIAPTGTGIPMAPYILTLIAVLFGCLVPFALFALHGSEDDSWLVRAYQGLRLSRVRLKRMLQKLQMDPAAYRRTVPVVLLKRQIAACRACPSKAACDRALVCREASITGLGFCPNIREIERQRQKQLPGSAPLARA